MKYCRVELPNWFQDQLIREYGPDPGPNAILSVLLEDYLERKKPCKHDFYPRYFWDWEKATEVEESKCIFCGVSES